MGYKNWRTPPKEYGVLDDEFAFTCDVAASKRNHLCTRYCTEDGKYDDTVLIKGQHKKLSGADGLNLEAWEGENVWGNPPYDVIQPWTDLARQAQRDNVTPVSALLLPPSFDTAWFRAFFPEQEKAYQYTENDYWFGFKTLNERFEYRYWKYRIRFLKPKHQVQVFVDNDLIWVPDENDPTSVVGESPRAGNLVVVHRA